ncbi:bidirectional sugar transporter SWEET17-like [Arachis ipaensis]|nr:bidirectional sugar transporter SWEET17-like [Arachis ipaensis]
MDINMLEPSKFLHRTIPSNRINTYITFYLNFIVLFIHISSSFMTTLIFAVGIIGTVLSLLVFASPITTFREVVKKKSTENYKVAPYIATFLCTSLWSFYGGLKPGGFLVAAVNGAGALFHCVYILLFLLYSPQHTKVKTAQYVGVVDVGFLAAVISVTVLGLDGTIQLTVLGMLCSGLTAVMYASPLLAMKTVIKTKSVEYMPFLLSLFMFLNAGAWALYSLLVRDFYIGIPNLVGLLLGLAQITVYLMYKEKARATSGKRNMMNAMEIGAYGYECEEKPSKTNTNGYDGRAIKVTQKALKKTNSLPKPTLNREQTIERVLQKALSFGEYNNDYHHDDVYSIIHVRESLESF